MVDPAAAPSGRDSGSGPASSNGDGSAAAPGRPRGASGASQEAGPSIPENRVSDVSIEMQDVDGFVRYVQGLNAGETLFVAYVALEVRLVFHLDSSSLSPASCFDFLQAAYSQIVWTTGGTA